MEGGKGLLGIAIKKGFVQKKGFWFVKMGGFCNQQEKVVFVHKKAAFADSKKLFEQRCFCCENERLLWEKRKAFCKWKTFGLRKRAVFSAHAKPTDKEKHFSAHNDTNFPPH